MDCTRCLLFLIYLFSCRPAFPQQLSVGLVQYPIEGNQSVAQVTKKMDHWVAKAKKARVDVVVFPELIHLDMWPVGPKAAPTPSDKDIVNSLVRPFETWVSTAKRLASAHQVTVLAGTFLRRFTDPSKKSALTNTGILAWPDGRTVLFDKVHLTPWEKQVGFSPGNTVAVFDLKGVRTTALICFDVESPAISAQLGAHNPELILVPSMTESLAGLNRVRWTAQARAVEHAAFVAVTGTVGRPAADFPHFGQALFVGPQLEKWKPILVTGPADKSALVVQSLDFKQLRSARQGPSVFHPAREQPPFEIKVYSSERLKLE